MPRADRGLAHCIGRHARPMLFVHPIPARPREYMYAHNFSQRQLWASVGQSVDFSEWPSRFKAAARALPFRALTIAENGHSERKQILSSVIGRWGEHRAQQYHHRDRSCACGPLFVDHGDGAGSPAIRRARWIVAWRRRRRDDPQRRVRQSSKDAARSSLKRRRNPVQSSNPTKTAASSTRLRSDTTELAGKLSSGQPNAILFMMT